MKPFQFRSPDEWRAVLLALPDPSFFELLRGVFGNIKTPFNKQRLMADLGAFLTRVEIQDAVRAYFDAEDHRIIAAVGALDEPEPEDLERFFAGEYTPLELHTLLLNLEERLILYRFSDDGKRRLALNPLLAPVLAPLVADKALLFPSEAAPPSALEAAPLDGPAAPRRVDDRILAALLAFMNGAGDFFKAEGGVRKKVLEEGAAVFPATPWETLIGGLEAAGLAARGEGRLTPDAGRLAAFQRLSFRERLEYWAAGIYTCLQDVRHFQPLRIQALARFIRQFTAAAAPGRRYPLKTLRRLASIVEREAASATAYPQDRTVAPGIAAGEFERFLEALEITGLLRLSGPGRWIRGDDSAPREASGPVIAMDSPFSCILFPEIPCADALLLASFCSAREAATVVRFEITRESAVRGFNQGLTAQGILENLERLSGGPADQNLAWTLKDWGDRYAAVSLHQGTVLILSEDRRYLARAEPLASLVSAVLGPGIYLLSVPDREAAAHALGKAGIDIIARPITAPPRSIGLSASPYPPARLNRFQSAAAEDRSFTEGAGPALSEEPEPAGGHAEAYKERFRSALGKLMLSKPEQDELAGRIDRRIILSESQLSGGAARSEKMEAKNLDYVGKIALAKQAIALKSYVEILAFNGGGDLARIFGVPEGLEKLNGETILALKPLSGAAFPEDQAGAKGRDASSGAKAAGETLKLPLGKIHLLRRIRQSIFDG
ncbi:MAG: hypothetical protein LBD37_10810 [Treponema sp.]|jgi:hypothetical protein|nr:hypothetical protein [Treponema sp.]